MKRPISISAFFPTYNEEDSISATVRAADEAIRQITDQYEIIIVNDGSTDRTRDIADRLAAENSRVRIVHHYRNMGYGAALWTGFQAARYEYVFFTDADMQFDLREIEKLADFVPEYQVVLGFRAPRRDPFMRLVNAWGWNFLNRMLFGLKVRDIDCAFKLIRRSLVVALPMKARGAMFSAELLIRLSRMGVAFKEVPVTHLPRMAGSPTGAKPAVIIRAFKELLAMYRGDLGHENVTGVQVVKFGSIGIVNTLIDVGAYFALTRFIAFFGEHLVSAKAISFFLGTVFSFIMNRRFTFGSRGRVRMGEILRFYSTVGSGIFVNSGAYYLFHIFLGMNEVLAVGIATIISFAWGFLFSKYWVFKKKDKGAYEHLYIHGGYGRGAHQGRND